MFTFFRYAGEGWASSGTATMESMAGKMEEGGQLPRGVSCAKVLILPDISTLEIVRVDSHH